MQISVFYNVQLSAYNVVRMRNVLLVVVLVGMVAAPSVGQPALSDRDVPVAGTTVRLRCGGTRTPGAPLVLLEAGAGAGVNGWGTVPGLIAEYARVCAYDRPGTASSGPYPPGLTATDHAGFVRRMLQAADEPAPYVLVGHSLGGIITALYAMSYPADVRGMVLVDPSHEDQLRRMEPITGPPPPKMIPKNPPRGVPPPPPPGLRFEEFAAAARAEPFRGDIPLVVLTGTRAPVSNDPIEIRLQPLFLELHKDLASRSPRSAHVLTWK